MTSEVSSITLRPSTDADLTLLFQIYASTREEELSIVPWTPEQKHGFLAMQFDCQHADYHKNYPDADFDIIESNGQPVGRIYLQRRDDEFRIIDIAILPAHRGAGIGTKVISDVITEASNAGKPVNLHVNLGSPAIRLYERLGFAVAGSNELMHLMERPPHALSTTAIL